MLLYNRGKKLWKVFKGKMKTFFLFLFVGKKMDKNQMEFIGIVLNSTHHVLTQNVLASRAMSSELRLGLISGNVKINSSNSIGINGILAGFRIR